MKKHYQTYLKIYIVLVIIAVLYLLMFPFVFLFRSFPAPINDCTALVFFFFGFCFYPLASIIYGVFAYKIIKKVLSPGIIFFIVFLAFMIIIKNVFLIIAENYLLDLGNVVSWDIPLTLDCSIFSVYISTVISILSSWITKKRLDK